jgi:general secretion pathway protein A
MAGKDWEQLRQRVLASCHLGPLTEAETRHYVEHRLRTVDWRDDPVWQDAAFAAVHRHSGGIPRRVNTLCSRVLLFGALEETHTITAAMIDTTAEELDRDLGAGLQALGPRHQPPADRDDLVRRIEQLEHHALRQKQIFKQVMDLLEASGAGRV